MYGFNIKNWYGALGPVKDVILQRETQATRGNGGGGGEGGEQKLIQLIESVH